MGILKFFEKKIHSLVNLPKNKIHLKYEIVVVPVLASKNKTECGYLW